MNELTKEALDAAERAVGEGPVVMINLLWFRNAPDYPAGFEGAKPNARSAYYEGYASAFRTTAEDLGVASQVVYAGNRLNGLLAGPNDDWDDIVVVRYERFADLRKIVESDAYDRTATPHRLAGIANWRFFATRGR
ncbi:MULTISPECIES: hypothetical protein [Bradyrhizobium]|uniref:hypothetical protein n=1 Tax=Bradyrhizobium elkanii TaxID=29448 RepID=UPI0012BD3910|nr:hypothetical protein [Bradyrhizobium elkanii]